MRARHSPHWLWTVALTTLLAIAAHAGKEKGGKPGGGGGGSGNTTALDILITIDRDELHAIQDDGSGQTYLAPVRGGYAWSPDGTQVAFYSDGLAQGYGVYVMDLGSGTTELLIPMALYSAGWLDWCPVSEADGTQKLAFTMREAATGIDVFVARFDDSGLVDYENVSATTGDEQSLTWSPTGKQLVVDYYNEIRVLDLSNRDSETGLPTAHTVYSSAQRSPSYPTWAKTGNRIAFTAYDSSVSHPLNDIYVLTVTQDAGTGDWTGSTPINLTDTPNDEENGMLSWSPDDSEIVASSVYWRRLGKGTGRGSLQRIDTSTGNRTKLLDGGVYPVWRRGSD